MANKLKTILTIGGSDPVGGAGIQADIRTGSNCGLHVLSVITAITVQNSKGFISCNPVSKTLFSDQLNIILEDVKPDAIKIGLIGDIGIAILLTEFIDKLNDIPVVTDPILAPTAKGKIYNHDFLRDMSDFYQNEIFPRSTVVTPNLKEAKYFLEFNGINKKLIREEIAILLLKLWKCDSLILKGGESIDSEIIDILADNFDGVTILSKVSHKRIICQNLHGTGCVYSSLLASYMALGFPINQAFIKTSEKITEIISKSCNYDLGNSIYGPMNINNYRI